MRRTLWKFRLALILAGLLLVVGGAIAVAAKGGTASSNQRGASAGAALNNQEPTEGTEHTPGTEPTETDQKEMEGTITSLDCAQGNLTIKGEDEEEGGAFTTQLTTATVFTVNGKAGACTDLKVGMSVTIEATQNGTTWTALKVSQGESDQDDDHDGDEPGSQTTPTPGAGDQTTPTPGGD